MDGYDYFENFDCCQPRTKKPLLLHNRIGKKMRLISDPFSWLSPTARKRLWVGSLLISAVSILAIKWLDASLVTDAAPSGIISFEFAGSMNRAQQILSSWDADAKIRCALSLGIDYLFLIAYALFISIACTNIARKLKIQRLFAAKVGFLLGWAQFIAAVLDAIENTALIRLLLGSQQEVYAWMAWGCAGVKFILVGSGLLYMVSGFIHIMIFQSGTD
jgi:hypothetical protein